MVGRRYLLPKFEVTHIFHILQVLDDATINLLQYGIMKRKSSAGYEFSCTVTKTLPWADL